MEKITSFTIDHLRLVPGLYVSRIDQVDGRPITTFDIRMTNPNEEPVMHKYTPSNIWAPHSCATMRLTPTRPSTSDLWAAAPVSIFFWPGNIPPKKSFR